MLLLHGWTGDEDAMWIFARKLDRKYWIISPRGLFPAPLGGFGWQENVMKKWPSVADFKAAVGRLLGLLDPASFAEADFSDLSAIGFSQGAALLFTLALTHPGRVSVLAGLSGFLPEDAQTLTQGKPLLNKRIFVAHGIADHLVPIEKARQAVDTLTRAGARVSYCEEDVGHKLSASCFRSMEAFFKINDLG
jgi:phospholipase/carboxylesterase